jgi:hypothetical protein
MLTKNMTEKNLRSFDKNDNIRTRGLIAYRDNTVSSIWRGARAILNYHHRGTLFDCSGELVEELRLCAHLNA